jgi:hypothetical protein
MEELFKSESNQLFATTDVAQCKKCGEQYAVFLPSIDDAQNGTYVADLEDRISKGCNKGTHSEVEIRLVVNP